jgi:hypothetical protein
MKPILAGYTNPTREPDTENPERREKTYLSRNDLVTHLHGIGATRSGKSKWLEWFCRGLERQNLGFTLIDPQGALAEDLVSYLAYFRPQKPVIYFDPSRTDYLIPFNPFEHENEDRVERPVRVDRQMHAVLRVWGTDTVEDTPRLARVLRCCLHLFSTGEITLNELHPLLMWDGDDRREYAAALIKENPTVRRELQDLSEYKRKREFDAQMGSTRNRLTPFIHFPQLKRIMSISKPRLDFEQVVEEDAIVIANLRPSKRLSNENGRLLGTLMIHQLWQAMQNRPKPPDRPHFLLVDEFQKFLTPDMRDILDRGAGKGLHLGLFHQHLSQLKEQDRWTYDSVMGNAKTKLVFGGLSREDALTMVDELFVNQVQYDEVKFLIEQTKFWPVYGRDKVYSRSDTKGSGTHDGSGTSQMETWNPSTEEWVPSRGISEMSGESEFESHTEGESDIPIFYPVPFKETTSKPTYSLEEQKHRLSDRLMAQYQRHYFLKRHGEEAIPAVTPFVQEYKVFPSREEEYIREQLIKPYGLSVETIDRRLKEQKQRFLRNGRLEEPDSWR